jgi:hypothetical protein
MTLDSSKQANDEVQRRAASPASNEGSLSQSSTTSLAYRRCGPRSPEPIVRFSYRDLERRSAMRVCQPGPLAFQRSMTSAGNRSVNNLRGFGVTGRPRFLITMRLSISSVSSGASSYSRLLITCVSTRLRSEPKERREVRFFVVICFSTNNLAASAKSNPRSAGVRSFGRIEADPHHLL